MSTSETVDFEIGKCPCGNGKIIKSVTTQDNPWSSADIGYSIECSSCNREWHIQHGCLVNSSTEAPYNAARREEQAKHTALTQLTNRIVDSYFAKFSAKTKKAEHAEMVRLGITNNSYRDFLKEKAKEKACSELCYALRNINWLTDLAMQAAVHEKFGRMIAEYDDAKKRTSETYGQIVRRPMPNRSILQD